MNFDKPKDFDKKTSINKEKINKMVNVFKK